MSLAVNDGHPEAVPDSARVREPQGVTEYASGSAVSERSI